MLTRRSLIASAALAVAAPAVLRRSYAESREATDALCMVCDISGSMFSNSQLFGGTLKKHIDIQSEGAYDALMALAPTLAGTPRWFSVTGFSGPSDQKIIVPWTLVYSADDVVAFALSFLGFKMQEGSATFQAQALWHAINSFTDPRVIGVPNKVIDFSTDTAPYPGELVEDAVNYADSQGIIVNAIAVEAVDIDTVGRGVASLGYGRSQSIVPDLEKRIATPRKGFVEVSGEGEGYAAALERKLKLELMIS